MLTLGAGILPFKGIYAGLAQFVRDLQSPLCVCARLFNMFDFKD
jgi:hypothetical protein